MQNKIRSGITACAYYVPEERLTHEELVQRFGRDVMDRIAHSSGIWERRIVRNGQCASDLALKAAEALLDNHQVARESIDLLIFGTQTPDYLLPTTACILQDRLGLSTETAAFDINLGCSQYVYSLSVAHSMICAGLANRALVLTGDTVSRILHPQDRVNVPLFGDAGTATLVERVGEEEGFMEFVQGTDGSGYQYLIWPASGLRIPRSNKTAIEVKDKSGSVRREEDMFMDGTAIFLFTLKVVPRTVKMLLAKTGLDMDDVDLFIFHQASEYIIESSAKKLKIPREKLHYKLHDVGNSGGSTVAIALTDAWLSERIKPGMIVLLVAFGVGLSWSSTIIRWPKHTLGPVCMVDYHNSPPRPPNQDIP